MDISDFEVILHTCSKTEMPPNPSKKAQIIILIPSVLQGTKLTKLTPEVSSIKPDRKGTINRVFTFNGTNIGFKILTNKLNNFK